jgi:peptide/nickel transport system substrate-binding protein
VQRRDVLKGAAAVPLLSAPGVVAAQGARVLRFVPQADLAITDPHFGIAFVTRNHAFLVFDFLSGLDADGRASAPGTPWRRAAGAPPATTPRAS